MGWELEAEVGMFHLWAMIANLFQSCDRAQARARAIELDFTNGGDEEDTMCPVCHESMPLPPLLFQGS
jgi:hypothetical protein